MHKINISSLLNFILFVFFCLGITLAKPFSLHLIPFYFSLCSLGIAYFFYKKNRPFISDVCIIVLFFLLGMCIYSESDQKIIDSHLNTNQEISLEVLSLPMEKKLFNSLKVKIITIDGLRVSQTVRLRDYTRKMKFLDKYKLEAKLKKQKFKNRYYYNLWLKKDTEINKLPLSLWAKFRKKTSLYLLSVFKENCNQDAARFLSAVFLGRRELVKNESNFFSKTGASHLLAISGLHLGLSSVILFFILGFFHLSFRLRLAVTVIFLFVYTFVTGAAPSTVRATIMFTCFGLAFFLKRKVNPLNSLALAGFVILISEPKMLFGVGFQLSFLAVFAIIIGFRVFAIKPSAIRGLSYFKYIFFSSLFVMVFLTPLTSLYFNKITILSVFYNIILIPYFSFLLFLAFILVVLSPFGFLAKSLGALLSLSSNAFVWLVKILSLVKLAFIPYTFSLKELMIYYIILLSGIFLLYIKKPRFLG